MDPFFPPHPYSPSIGPITWGSPGQIPHEFRNRYKSDPAYQEWCAAWKRHRRFPMLQEIITTIIAMAKPKPTRRCIRPPYEPDPNYVKTKEEYKKLKLKKEEEELKLKKEEEKNDDDNVWGAAADVDTNVSAEEISAEIDPWVEMLDIDTPADLLLESDKPPKDKVTFNNT